MSFSKYIEMGFLEEHLNDVVLGDCLDLFKNLDDKSIDVSFTSPPYFSVGGGNSHNNKDKYLEPEKYKDWVGFQINVIDELLRVTKKYVLYNIQPLHGNKSNVYKLIGRYAERIHEIIIWYKPNGAPTSTPHKISNKYEFLIILKPYDVDAVDVNSEYYTNVIVKKGDNDNEYSDIHRAVMNKPFCDEVIHEFTKENDIVLDPFFGTGTTGISCKEQNRRFIGFEINKTYYEISKKRINGIRRNGQMSIFTDFDEV